VKIPDAPKAWKTRVDHLSGPVVLTSPPKLPAFAFLIVQDEGKGFGKGAQGPHIIHE
jgi:hypothetical protein